MKIKAVFFDMDGTLVNSMNDLAASTNYAMAKFGYPEKPIKNYAYYAGNGIYVMIERALEPNKVDAETLKQIRDVFFDYYKDHCTVHTAVYKGVPELIAALKEKGIKVGCITNKVEPIAKNIINHFFGGMDVVYGQIDGVPNKPDPLLTLKALDELGLDPKECLFVGDTSVDIETALNSGAVSLGVLWGFRTEDELRGAGADYIVSDAKEILEIIDTHE